MLSERLVAEGLNAGKLVKDAAKLIQGGGGGQPHFATAGARMWPDWAKLSSISWMRSA